MSLLNLNHPTIWYEGLYSQKSDWKASVCNQAHHALIRCSYFINVFVFSFLHVFLIIIILNCIYFSIGKIKLANEEHSRRYDLTSNQFHLFFLKNEIILVYFIVYTANVRHIFKRGRSQLGSHLITSEAYIIARTHLLTDHVIRRRIFSWRVLSVAQWAPSGLSGQQLLKYSTVIM